MEIRVGGLWLTGQSTEEIRTQQGGNESGLMAAQLLGRAIGAGLFAITPEFELGTPESRSD
ncbi:mCG1041637 [Mus musculus]|nr:mCG1041637 [Mus musculus]